MGIPILGPVLGWLGVRVASVFAKATVGGTIEKLIRIYQGNQNASTEAKKIEASVLVSALDAWNQSQRMKYASSAFWLMALILIVPMAFKWGMINLYDVFWCRDCMFSQEWTIAAYEPPYDRQAETAFNWVFGGAGAGVGFGLIRKFLGK